MEGNFIGTATVEVNRSMTRWFQTPFYPALIALFIPLNLFVQNYSLFRFADTIRPIAAFVLMAALIFVGTAVLFRRRDVAALIASFSILGLWIYPLGSVGFIWLIITVLLIGFIVCRPPVSPKATAVLNIAALALNLHLAVTISLIEIRYAEQKPDYVEYSPFYDQPLDPAKVAGPLPSIIHIVLDGYASNTVLKEIMGFDNTPFTDALAKLGFFVAEDVRTPYNQTSLTMASIFIGDYLKADRPPMTIENNHNLRLKLNDVVSHGPVHHQLSRLGYKFLATKSSLIFSRFSDETALSVPSFSPFSLNFYEIFLVQNTALRIAAGFFGIADNGFLRRNETLQHAVTNEFYNRYDRPYLFFEHVLAPHPPFIIDRHGEPTDKWSKSFASIADGDAATKGDPALQAEYVEGYIEKLRYTNRAILAQVRRMLESVPAPKVIIIHGDHGSGSLYFHDDADRSCLKERFSPFLATYSDDPAIASAFAAMRGSRINLVNLYRTLFDARFGTVFGPLADRSYFANWNQPQRPRLLDGKLIAEQCGKH